MLPEEGGDAEVDPGVQGAVIWKEGNVSAVGWGFEMEVCVGGGEGGWEGWRG